MISAINLENKQRHCEESAKADDAAISKTSFFRVKYIISKIQLFLFIVILIFCLSGCWVKEWTNFDPVKEEQPITMFNRYLLKLNGVVITSPQMDIDVSFIREITDTNNLDTIPVFIIDSVCFHGSCLDSAYCREPLDLYELSEDLKKKNPDFPGYNFGIPLSCQDLLYIDGKLIPIKYGLNTDNTIPLPTACMDKTVTVEIQARLLDRLTGKELARENKTVRFLLEIRKKRIILSQARVPHLFRGGFLLSNPPSASGGWATRLKINNPV